MKKILVTGASGFIGKSLCKELNRLNRSVRGTFRHHKSFIRNTKVECMLIDDMSLKTSWKETLVGIHSIVHCAAKVHIMHETKKDKLESYQKINIDSTKILAEQAAEAGIKRLVFLSTVKVLGEETDNRNIEILSSNQKKKYIFTHEDTPNPKDAYSRSKLEAEKILWEISRKSDLEITVVRLPLVYGKGVKGNLKNLIKLLQTNIPLPLAAIQNQRSMIGIDNLISLLICCIDHPNAAGKTFLVSDCENLSTPELINNLACSMGYKVRLFKFPIFLLKIIFSILGRKKEINRLVGSLRIDSSYTQKVLNWRPPISVAEGIKRMVQGK
jgi:nucleoside-diphosphate-sugar epimerase